MNDRPDTDNSSAESIELLSPAELTELDRMRRHLALRAASEGGGAHRSPRRGESPELVDHRGYAAGDDLRRLDWNILARTDQAMVRRYRAEEEAAVRIAIDLSGSMAFGEPTKASLARKIAAAVAYIGLADGERVQIGLLGASRVAWSAAARGRGRYGAVARFLIDARVDATLDGSPDAAPMEPEARLGELLRRAGRAGVLVVVTDAIAASGDLDAWPRAIGRARSSGHEVRLIQLLTREEIDPPWDGDLAMVDAETGRAVEVTFDARARAAYAARLEALVTALREQCRRSRATYVRGLNDETALAIVRRLASGGLA